MSTPPIIAIVGQTTSGKSALSLQLAQQLHCDILCADATTVYRGFDIGAAKPSMEEQRAVRHFGLDIADPAERFDVAAYKTYADGVLAEQAKKERLTLLVGGSGLYVDSVLYDYSFPATSSEADAYDDMPVGALQKLVREHGGEQGQFTASDWLNPRRLIAYLRRGGVAPQKHLLPPHVHMIGITTTQDELERRIERRVDAMLAAGLEDEVRGLAERYGWDVPAMQAIGYREFKSYVMGDILLMQVREHIIMHTRQLAKKQRVWMQRNPDITWAASYDELVALVTTYLD
jgi:tRNA dimethylallyltransferase